MPKDMAGIKDILAIEKQRDNIEDWHKMNMFKEGNFLRCYEVSAWLCHRFISEYKVTHRHVKGIEQSVFCWFPSEQSRKVHNRRRYDRACFRQTFGDAVSR